ncbi:RNA-binding domain-containing protein [Thiothrix nivea]|uniref:Putative transcriptional regulator n=1 Tax=Thiothrix nivea (strain ATCC 35100 / DSM 5205 / JP2) TaxID=870187 RepID=A0A656HKM8_THINJ|nr:RNA-binding domain-containing protein [Thiothrix nivea]EIJ35575.1 putative transcriptional regulator [Thiothrix nivea DSM 5205]
MDTQQVQTILAQGEDSRHQFKRNISNVDAFAAELAALANAGGGYILIGVDDNSSISGLSREDISRLNQLLSNASSQHVRPPIHPTTQNMTLEQGIIMVITVPEGLNKPYVDNQGRIWVKAGADKRHVTAREEIQRMFQETGLVYAEETPIADSSSKDLHELLFANYIQTRYQKTLDELGLPLPQIIRSLKLGKDNVLNLAGLLLFGKNPQQFRPAFMVKAVYIDGTDIASQHYRDSEDIEGPLINQYERALSFITRNLHRLQAGQGINSLGKLEIPEITLQEVLVNALIHRDYFISAPIRILMFTDRVEIISPGHLPNHLTVEQIRFGLSNMRNPIIASHATRQMPYRGLGSGIPRALENYANIQLIDDRKGNQFKVIMQRPVADKA